MSQLSRRSTVYFDPKMHQALRLKAARENRSISDIVNEAVALLASEDAGRLGDLPLHHRDPFDRMLIAQSLSKNLCIMTEDLKFSAYECDLINPS